ncbi:MAG: PIG-L family deacetylase [Campylobacterota bacterium]|nr:PIG-L family deacetylase [Campylobacterota bacterium]
MTIYILFTLFCLYLFLVFKRAKRYKYNQTEDYIYNLESNFISEQKLQGKILKLPDNYKDFDTLFLKVELSLNPLSYFFKPYIEIQNQKHFFEYGAKGIRYINLSHIPRSELTLKLHSISLKTDITKFYAYKNDVDLSKKILILAPHADDAEIAAFGLYKSAKNITIVTTTAGESGVCNYCDIYKNDKLKSSLKKAELRVFDAISVPLLGDVDIKNSIALGYFSGTLKWMSQNREKIASSQINEIKEMNNFRKVSHAKIKLKESIEPTYTAFLEDLKEIVKQVQPDIIITPHPTIDSHTDHQQTTLGMIEVLQEQKLDTKLLLYTNHLKLSESYPVGDMHSTITLPPNKQEFSFNSIYSFYLDDDLQIDKFFALESIHDLRDSTLPISIKNSFKHLNKMIKRRVTGKDKRYYKRAVRSNELFFIVNRPL